MPRRYAAFPPPEFLDPAPVADAAQKTRRLDRLYHLTQTHAWDGKALLGGLVERHGPPGTRIDPKLRPALGRLLTTLLWGELAAWNISADLALEIDELDAKLAATGQVFDEARHFHVLRDYLVALHEQAPLPPLGGFARRLMLKVLNAPTLAQKLVGMQLLFETNAVVLFRRIQEAEFCPILTELLPYFERDESRHVGLGVMYVPRLIARMSTAEARATSRFQLECLLLLMANGFVFREDFDLLGMDQRLMATRVTRMQDEVVRQMVDQHGRSVLRAVASPASGLGPQVLDFLHPPAGVADAGPLHRTVHRGLTRALSAVDHALA